MSMLDGLSQCWWLSDTCSVNWDAWAAVGTFFAAFMALRISLAEQCRRRQEAMDRALGLSTLLEPDIEDWLKGIRLLVNHVNAEHAQAITESFDPEGGDVLRVPTAIRENLHRIHELDEPARELSIAVTCAVAAKKMEPRVREALREGALDREVVLDLFRRHLGEAGGALMKASNSLNERIFLAPKKRAWWKRILLG